MSATGLGRGRGRGRRPAREMIANALSLKDIVEAESKSRETLENLNGYIDSDSIDGCATTATSRNSTYFAAKTHSSGNDPCKLKSKDLFDTSPLLSATTPAREREIITSTGEVPDRFINTQENLPIKIAEVDFMNRVIYIIFTDDKTKLFSRDFSCKLNQVYGTTDDDNKIHILLEDIKPNELVVARDINGVFHRATSTTTEIGFMIDLDTRKIFRPDKTAIFKMLPEFQKAWLQAVKCKVELQNCPTNQSWSLENKKILSKSYLLDRCLLSAIELNLSSLTGASNLQRTDEESVLNFPIDICGTKDLIADTFQSLSYFTIPRIPTVGSSRIAVLTNIRKGGYVDVVFHDNVSLCVREIVKEVAEHYKQTNADNSVFSSTFQNLISKYSIRDFVASFGNEWSRARVLNIEDDKSHANVHFVDLGKKKIIPLKDIVLPCRSHTVPELLEYIYPQVVGFQLKDWNKSDDDILKNIRSVLEGMPCYVEVVNDDNDKNNVPYVKLWANITDDRVISLIDYLHDDLGSENPYPIQPLKHLVKQLEKFNRADVL